MKQINPFLKTVRGKLKGKSYSDYIAEAARNVVCSGAKPLAITNCLNFGNPMKPEIFWQFRKAVEGISEACQELGVTVLGQEVSTMVVGGELAQCPGTIVDGQYDIIGFAIGIGDEEKDNGVLLLIAHDDRELFLATGYGLEGAVPDIVAKGIVEKDILPHFREGNYYDGITAGLDALEMHIAGEYTADRYLAEDESDWGAFGGAFIFFLFILLQWFGAIMARTKSWWLGGVLGGVLGLILAFVLAWWIAIPFFVLFGLALDYAISKNYKSRGKTKWWAGGGWGPGGGGSSGSGGFGGFSGGSFGGGGSGGSW